MLKNIIKRMLLVSCVCVFSLQGGERTVEELIKEGDKLADQNYFSATFPLTSNLNPATNRYWQAAAKGSPEALQKLSKLYAIYDKAYRHWEKEDPQKYMQLAADCHYKKEDAVYTPVELVIIKDENEIIQDAVNQLFELSFDYEEHGVYFNKFKDWGWARRPRAAIAIEQLKKNISIDGKNGRFICRSRKFKSGKIVALVDTQTAKENFDFYKSDAVHGEIYFRGFPNKNLLVPLNKVIEYSIASEVDAFSDIVQKLGAKSLEVAYLSSRNTEKEIGGVVITDGHSASVNIKSQIHKKFESLANRSWRGNSQPQKFDSPWFKKKPEWEEVYKARHNSYNPMKSHEIKWRFQTQIEICNEIRATFDHSKYSGKLRLIQKLDETWAYSIKVIFE